MPGFLEDTDDFIFADEEDVAAGIEDDTGADYDEVGEDEVSEEDSDDEEGAEEEGEEDPSDDSDPEEDEAEEEDSQEEAPPAKTGDKDTDGKEEYAYKQRQRRKEAEQKVAALEREIAYIKGKLEGTIPQEKHTPEPEEELPELDYADLEGSFDTRYMKLREREARLQAQREADAWNARVNASAQEARQEYPDYDEVETAFAERLKGNQHLMELLRSQPDPAEWAYHNQKRYEARVNSEDPEVENLRKKVAELEKAVTESRQKKPKRSKSMANARGGVGKRAAKTSPEDADTLFRDLFGR